MKKSLLFVFLVCICLLMGCNTNGPNDSQFSYTNDDAATSALVKPDAMQELAEDPKDSVDGGNATHAGKCRNSS